MTKICVFYFLIKDFLEDGLNFQLLVQIIFLNSNKEIGTRFGDNILISGYETFFVWDCYSALPFIRIPHAKFLFHFYDPTHFAFDSMLYDGDQKILVLIQITINKDHDIHYQELMDLINKEENEDKKKENKKGKKGTKKGKPEYIEEEEKKNEEKVEQKIEKQGNKKNKYQKFFEELDNSLVNSFVFQWMTRDKFPEIRNKTKLDHYKLKDHRSFKIYYYHEELYQKLRYGN